MSCSEDGADLVLKVGNAVARDPLNGIRVAVANRGERLDVLADVLLEPRRWEGVVGRRSRWAWALESPRTSLTDPWSPRRTWLANLPRLDHSTVVNSGSAWLPS